MGGVPTLLLAIAVGITYGWQPDREGGVEYIIQVPPDQIEQLQKTGEISSVIAPEVQGRVSRVIIRVGEGPLPREMPAMLPNQASSLRTGSDVLGSSAALGNSVANSYLADATPVPIPEMVDSTMAQPIAGLRPGSLTGEQAVLKPDTNAPPGTGYGFPALPPTLQSGTGQVDQAGREVGSPVGSQVNSILGPSTAGANPATSGATSIKVPPPGTRAPAGTSAISAPPFTGSDPQGDYARVRVGGPSTDPTNPRDNSWSDFSPPTSTAAATTTGQSPNLAGSPGNPGDNPFRNPAANSVNLGAGTTNSGTASGGLAPGDTYGQFPSGLSFSGVGDRTTASSGVNNYGAAPNTYAGNPAAPSLYGAAGTAAAAGNTGASVAGSSPDPRLTPVQMAAGAWSIDAYGRIYDRQGRLMNGTNLVPGSAQTSSGNSATALNPVGNPSSGLGYTGNATTIFGNQNAGTSSNLGFASNDTAWNQAQAGSSTAYGGNGFQTGTGRPDYEGNALATGTRFPGAPPVVDGTRGSNSGFRDTDFRDRDSVRRTSTAPATDTSDELAGAESKRAADPPSLSDRRYPESTELATRRDVVAPQPLFNGLLLISLVANVYLIFWLKNLRIQFRDLVAAKRMASSNTP